MTIRSWTARAVAVGVAVVLSAACGSESDESTNVPEAGSNPFGGGDGGAEGGPLGEAGYQSGDGSPGTCVPFVAADGTSPQCSDCKDNDGDGLVDWRDPECAGPLDNDEQTFGTGIAGDNVDACKQDCFFDGNSGQGDDKCEWNLRCDPKIATGECSYDPSFKNCPATQSAECVTKCQSVTPNGCDCFGCCAVNLPNGTTTNVRLSSTCSLADLADPAKCAPCTLQPSCANDCATCELCIGKTTLPPECGATGGTGQTCSQGAVCNETSPCADGLYCVTGCCQAIVR